MTHARTRLAQLRAALDRALASGTTYPVSIPAAEGERLREWVIGERAEKTIEIGLAHGISALYVCAGLIEVGARNARHVAMDPNQAAHFANAGRNLVRDAGAADLLEFIAEPSEVVLPRLLAHGRRFDLAFVDGNHRFDWVFVDLVFLGRVVRPGGVIFVDDYQLPSIAKAVAFFVANVGWRVEETSREDQLHSWTVLRTADAVRDRHFTDFVDF